METKELTNSSVFAISCTKQQEPEKYATLRQLKFQKDMPKLYLQNKIINFEKELKYATAARATNRAKMLEQKLAPLYNQLMGIWERENVNPPQGED